MGANALPVTVSPITQYMPGRTKGMRPSGGRRSGVMPINSASMGRYT